MGNGGSKRICRICWNTKGWTCPSGRIGKSKGNSFEAKYGVGSEEWLFRKDFRLDGYQYGFLEPINKFPKKYSGQKFDLILYTRNSETGNKYWVGSLDSVEVLTDEELMNIQKKLELRRWQDTIWEEAKVFTNYNKQIRDQIRRGTFFLPNVRFKADQIAQGIYEELIPVKKNDKSITANRYILLNVSKSYSLPTPNRVFDFNSGRTEPGYLKDRGKRRKPALNPKESELRHNKLIIAFQKYMQTNFGKEIVRSECRSNENRVDIVRKTGNEYIFYELKTYNHVRTCLRVALGQLFEYALFPENKYAFKIVLVTDEPPDKETEAYIRHLIKHLKIQFGYIHFDLESNNVMLEI